MLKYLAVCVCLIGISAAQTSQPAAKPSVKPVPAASAVGGGMPSEDEVDAFMKQMVGYNPDVTWKVTAIRPTGIPGLTEVIVVISDQQGSNTNKFYVTADGKHAVTGEIIAFG